MILFSLRTKQSDTEWKLYRRICSHLFSSSIFLLLPCTASSFFCKCSVSFCSFTCMIKWRPVRIIKLLAPMFLWWLNWSYSTETKPLVDFLLCWNSAGVLSNYLDAPNLHSLHVLKSVGYHHFWMCDTSLLLSCRDFRHEKTKKKRGTYRGGQIDLQSHSIKFNYSDEEWDKGKNQFWCWITMRMIRYSLKFWAFWLGIFIKILIILASVIEIVCP